MSLKTKRTLVGEALLRPLGFESLTDILFPEDRLLVVPDAEIASEPEILAEIVAELLQAGMQASDVSILLTEADEKKGDAARTTSYAKLLPDGVSIPIHQPSRRDRLALLGVNANGQPIALCRELVDADMILTVGRFFSRATKDYFGLHTALFPRFADQETQFRFATAAASATARRKLREEVEEVARQLGILFTVQLLSRQGKTVRVLAGLPQIVAKQLASKE